MLKLYSYELPLTSEGKRYFSDKRTGLLLSLKDKSGREGISEYAPLSSVHHYGLKEVIKDINNKKECIEKDVFGFIKTSSNTALTYLLSLALFHIEVKKHTPLLKSLRQSALLPHDTTPNTLKAAEIALRKGYTCLKIKVGSLLIKEEIEKIKKIRLLCGKKITLRIDGNAQYSLAQAIEFGRAIKRLNIDYFEEPIKNFLHHEEFVKKTGIEYAIDENLPLHHDSFCIDFILSFINKHNLKTVVIKPSRCRNIFELKELIKIVKHSQRRVILSTCFESDYSASLFSALAHISNINEDIHGVFMEGLYSENVCSPPMRTIRGKLDGYYVLESLKKFRLKEERLKRLI